MQMSMKGRPDSLSSVSARRWAYFVAAALPALFPLAMVLHYGVDVPHWDEWAPALAGIYVKAHAHSITFADLVAQHNEHRFLVPRLLLLPLNALTHFNPIAEMVLEWLIVLIT